jgi:hypothetical protein
MEGRMQGNPRDLGAWRGLAVCAAVVLLGPIVVFVAAASASMVFITSEPAWTAASGEPVPAKFEYAMFPINATVALHDAPDGTPVRVLDRAVVNSQREIDAGGWIRVLNPAGDTWVRLSELAYLPPAGATVDYFAAFAAVYPAQIADEFGNASLKLESASMGTTLITLRLGQDDHAQSYVYEVSNGHASPKRYTESGIGDGLRAVGFAFGATVLYEAVAVVVIVVRMARRRPRQLA